MAERFSDEDTGVSKYTQGDDAKHLNDTATGISIIMNAAALPAKEVAQNVDSMWIEPCLKALLEWDMDHLEVDTVARMHGQRVAQSWAQAKQFYATYGSTSFMRWKATGTSTYVAREVLMTKLTAFVGLVAANPEMGQYVDLRELLEQVWAAAEVGKENPVRSKEEMAKYQQATADPIAQMRAAMDGVPKDSALFPAMMKGFLARMGIQGPEVDLATQIMLKQAEAKSLAAAATIGKVKAQAHKAEADAHKALAEADAAAAGVGVGA